MCGSGGTVAGIYGGAEAGRCHALAKKLGARYQSMEPIDSTDLYRFAELIGGTERTHVCQSIIDFASQCMTSISTPLSTVRKRFLQSTPPRLGGISKNSDIFHLLVKVYQNGDMRSIYTALQAIRKMPDAKLSRKELWDAMLAAVREFDPDKHKSLQDAAWQVRNRLRHAGRRLDYRCISRTLLIKGLEFDHAIVLDADSLSPRELYVAMTRGSRSLTVLSASPIIDPWKLEGHLTAEPKNVATILQT